MVSRVGKPISSDKMTLTKERLSFARVLVEVDASTEIVSDVEIRLPTGVVYHQLVTPEFIPKFCIKCKTFGHLDGACGKGAEGRKHTMYVAKRRLQNAGGSVSQAAGGCSPVLSVPVAEEIQPVAGRPATSGPVVKEVQPAVQHLVVPTVGAAPPTIQQAEVLAGCSVGGAASGSLEAGMLPTMSTQVAVPIVSGDGGWTTVGKKGKKKKNTGQPGEVAVQQQQVGDGMQLEHVEVGSSGTSQKMLVLPGLPGAAAGQQQVSGKPGVVDVQQHPDGEGVQMETEEGGSPRLAPLPYVSCRRRKGKERGQYISRGWS